MNRALGVAFAIGVAVCGCDRSEGGAADVGPLGIKPKNVGGDVQTPVGRPTVSLLIRSEAMYLGVADADIAPTVFDRKAGRELDWKALENALASLQRAPALAGRTDMEIAVDGSGSSGSAADYRDLVHAMEIAVNVGFRDVGITDAASLSWRPTLPGAPTRSR